MKAQFSAVVAAFIVLSAPARADTPEETAFGLGQFIGAASFCKIEKAKVQEVATALLTAAGIDASGPSPVMTKFTQGVTDGVRSMSGPEAASCADVTTAFNEAYAKVQ